MNEVLYTTDDLAKMFRVGKSTIKRWTDEGKLQCFKTPGGHRKFKPSNVHEFIKQYHYEIITPILPFSRTAEEISSNSMTLSVDESIEEMFRNSTKGLRQPIEAAFSNKMMQESHLSSVFDQLLTPVLRMIHTKYQQRQITSVEFQIAKNTLTHSLIHFAETLPKSEKKNVEMYCLSVHEGMNEVELKAVELLLENIGMTVYNLGTVLTKYAANDIVQQCKPDDVFVVLSLDHSTDEIVRQFNSLVTGVKSYGGNVYTSNFFEENASTAAAVNGNAYQIHSFAEIVDRFNQMVSVA